MSKFISWAEKKSKKAEEKVAEAIPTKKAKVAEVIPTIENKLSRLLEEQKKLSGVIDKKVSDDYSTVTKKAISSRRKNKIYSKNKVHGKLKEREYEDDTKVYDTTPDVTDIITKFIIPLVGIGVVLMVGLMVMNQLKEALVFQTVNSTVGNSTITTMIGTLGNLPSLVLVGLFILPILFIVSKNLINMS